MSEPRNRHVILANRPDGKPTTDDFEVVSTPVPEVGRNGVLVRTLYLSVDPYMRGRMRESSRADHPWTVSYEESWDVGEPLSGRLVGEVVESDHPDWDPGDVAYGTLDWAEYGVAKGTQLQPVDTGPAPLPTALGALGMPGRTAYIGLLDIGRPKPGETVVVTAAAGAVGSVVGQIAKLNGCEVVGITGSNEKCTFLTEDLGFEVAINYRTTDNLQAAVSEAAPGGVDLFFENVGGEIGDAVFANLADGATVVVCGQIALYNEEETPTGPRHTWQYISAQARVEGFSIRNYTHRYADVTEQLAEWVAAGDLTTRETITEGLENAPDAFLGLFEGENVGKQLVMVAEYEGG